MFDCSMELNVILIVKHSRPKSNLCETENVIGNYGFYKILFFHPFFWYTYSYLCLQVIKIKVDWSFQCTKLARWKCKKINGVRVTSLKDINNIHSSWGVNSRIYSEQIISFYLPTILNARKKCKTVVDLQSKFLQLL